MVFSIEQLEHVSRTIFQYELRPIPVTKEIAAAHAANVFSTGNATPILSWTMNTQLGALPLCLDHGPPAGDHLLDYAAAFRDHSYERDLFLSRLKEELSNSTEALRNASGRRLHYTARELPPPPDPSLRLTTGIIQLFHPSHAAWYTPRALAKIAHAHLTYQSGIGTFLSEIGRTLERSSADTAVLARVATQAAMGEFEKRPSGTTDYVALAQLIPLCEQEEVDKLFCGLDSVYRVLAITLRDPSKLAMITGLRTLANTRHLNLLAFMGRAPTLEELLESNIRGAARIWRLMPWALFGPVVKAHGEALRGALIKRTEMPYDELRTCLVNHDDRIALYQDKLAKPAASSSQDFETFAANVRQYHPSSAAREILCATYPLDVVKLIALRHHTAREDLAAYVDPILTLPAKEALSRCKVAYPAARGAKKPE